MLQVRLNIGGDHSLEMSVAHNSLQLLFFSFSKVVEYLCFPSEHITSFTGAFHSCDGMVQNIFYKFCFITNFCFN